MAHPQNLQKGFERYSSCGCRVLGLNWIVSHDFIENSLKTHSKLKHLAAFLFLRHQSIATLKACSPWRTSIDLLHIGATLALMRHFAGLAALLIRAGHRGITHFGAIYQ